MNVDSVIGFYGLCVLLMKFSDKVCHKIPLICLVYKVTGYCDQTILSFLQQMDR